MTLRSLLPLLLAGCSTLNGARPLSPGEHAVGLTLGGPLVTLGAPLPLPNAVVEARHGVAEPGGRPLDLSYGLNLTGLPFGVVQGHVGLGHLLMGDAEAGPALAMTNRAFFASNPLGPPGRTEPTLAGWGLHQIEFTASTTAGKHLFYGSVSQYTDLRAPSLTLTPAIGAELSAGRFFVQPELRWFAPHRRPTADNVPFVSGNGLFGASVAVGRRFGGRR